MTLLIYYVMSNVTGRIPFTPEKQKRVGVSLLRTLLGPIHSPSFLEEREVV